MVDALQGIGDKIVAVIMGVTAVANGLFSLAIPQQQTANIVTASVTVVSATTTPATALAVAAPAVIMPNLLPTVVLAKHPIKLKPTPPPKSATTTVAPPPPTPAPAPKPSATPTATAVAVPVSSITAQWLLDNAKLSFRQKRDGTFEATFNASAGAQNISWGIADTGIGGTAGIPKFSLSISCNPPPTLPDLSLADQTPYLTVRTTYDCKVGIAALSGNDQSLKTKDFTFTTGAGQLVVTPPQSMNVLLADDINNGGFVFNNQDANPITITGLTLDMSFTALSTSTTPLVFRVLDPTSDTSIYDYHMENFDATTAPYTNAATGVTVPLSFTVPANTQKLLPIQILGVHRLSITGVDPTITLTLRSVATNESDVAAVLSTSQLQWSCIVPVGAYDPNATSGPAALGLTCR